MRPWSGYAPCERCGVFPGARHDYRCDCHAAERRIVCDRPPRADVCQIDTCGENRASGAPWPAVATVTRDGIPVRVCACHADIA